MKFDESKHPRDEDGKFTDGSGGKSYRQNTRYEEILADDKRREAERIYNSGYTYDSQDDFGELIRRAKNTKRKPKISKREYAVLRSEVIRKNSAQKGEVKPINHAFTANHFYVYSTEGDDDFTVLEKYSIKRDGKKIDKILKSFGRYNGK